MERPDLDEIISLLGESVDMIRTLRWRQDYFPEMGSPAHKAWINFHNPVGAPAYQAYHLAAGHLGAAEDNVLALELLLNEGSSSVAPFVVARASIEACGRAHLLLDPALSDKARSELAIGEAVYELHSMERLVIAHDPRLESDQVRSDLEHIRHRVRSLRQKANEGGYQVPGRPRFIEVVRGVMAIGTADETFGGVTAELYSAIAHAVPLILVSVASNLEESLGHVWGVGFSDIDEKTTRDLVVAVLVAYFKPVTRQVEAFGWPPSSWTRWCAHARVVLRASMRDPRSTT
jgi:hypothetical protein